MRGDAGLWVNPRGYPRWDGSDAETLLRHDVEIGKHKVMKPEALWNTKNEYKQFPPKVFRDHIY